MIASLFGNGTDIVHWKDSPTTRGTFDILTICLTTLLLCVWTAVHLNVAPPESTWRLKFGRKIGWLVLTLIAPEMVAYTAWYQRSEAKDIMRTVNKARGLSNPASWFQSSLGSVRKAIRSLRTFIWPQQRKFSKQPTLEAQRAEERRPWTMVHGFYAVMGGFAFRYPDNLPESQRFLPTDESEIWFLSGNSAANLIKLSGQNDTPLDISEEDIRSKSKANGLAKTLVCIQALWFIAQCLTRLIAQTPISLLELNTFGHAICALLIYFLWWEKPFEVDYPSFVQDQDTRDLFALFCMNTRPLTAEPLKQKLHNYIQDYPHIKAKEKEELRAIPFAETDMLEPLITKNEDEPKNVTIAKHNDEHKSIPENRSSFEDDATVLLPGQSLLDTGWKVLPASGVSSRGDDYGGYGYNLRVFHAGIRYSSGKIRDTSPNSLFSYEVRLGIRDVNRWKMAWRLLSPILEENPKGFLYESNARSCFHHRINDLPDMEMILDDFRIAIGFCAAAFVYGGLHALAWAAHLESPTQRLLWRISACVVIGGLPTMCLLWRTFRYSNLRMPDPWDDALAYFCGVLAALTLLAYVLARAYLVVECFIQLFNLPPGAFDVPQWAAYFPHIS